MNIVKSLIASACAFAQLTNVALATLCDQLCDVRVIPFKDEKVADAAYNAIVEAGEASIPCLVENLVNTHPMPNPRKVPPYGAFTVGDLASMLLCEITGRSFEEQLPKDLRASFPQRGVLVYFEYVKKSENRAALQADWTNWLAKRLKK